MKPQFILLGLIVSGAVHAQTAVGCAPTTNPNDKAALQIAKLNAVTQSIRDRDTSPISGQANYDGNPAVRQVGASASARFKHSRVIRQQMFTNPDGSNQRLCVEVQIHDSPQD